MQILLLMQELYSEEQVAHYLSRYAEAGGLATEAGLELDRRAAFSLF